PRPSRCGVSTRSRRAPREPRWPSVSFALYMRSHRYSKFSPELADAVDLQSLLDKLADFLLQSGFAGGGSSSPWGDPDMEQEGDRSLDALKQAILDALIESGQIT